MGGRKIDWDRVNKRRKVYDDFLRWGPEPYIPSSGGDKTEVKIEQLPSRDPSPEEVAAMDKRIAHFLKKAK